MTDDPLPDLATRLDAVATAGPAHVRWEPLTALLREAAGEIRRLREATETKLLSLPFDGAGDHLTFVGAPDFDYSRVDWSFVWTPPTARHEDPDA